MTTTHSATVSTGGATTVSFTNVPTEFLETLAVELECGGAPTYLTGKHGDALSTYLQKRHSIAQEGSSGTVMISIGVDPAHAPDALQSIVSAFEAGDVDMAEMSEQTLQANLDSHTVSEYRLKGTMNSDGDISLSSFCAFYEEPWSQRDEPTADFEGRDDRLVLSHREVIENAPESMYIPGSWGEPAHRSAVNTAAFHEGDGFHDYLYGAVIEGHVTDGYWENAMPPFDFTALLDDEELRGELMYYAYRYQGWAYTQEQLQDDLLALTEQYGDIGL